MYDTDLCRCCHERNAHEHGEGPCIVEGCSCVQYQSQEDEEDVKET